VFGLILLNTKLEPIAWHVLSRGCLDATLVHPREVVKVACLGNAAALVVAHNHPSGDPAPSPEDVATARRLGAVLSLVGISLIDSIVIGEAGRYSSLRETGQLQSERAAS
jgi:DNA repair protein RadC